MIFNFKLFESNDKDKVFYLMKNAEYLNLVNNIKSEVTMI